MLCFGVTSCGAQELLLTVLSNQNGIHMQGKHLNLCDITLVHETTNFVWSENDIVVLEDNIIF